MTEEQKQMTPDTAQALLAFTSALQGLAEAGLLPKEQLEGLSGIVPTPAPTPEQKPVEPQGKTPLDMNPPASAPKTKKPVAPNHVSDFIKWFINAPEEHLYDVKRGQWECITGSSGQGGTGPAERRAHVLKFHSKVPQRGVADNVICTRPIGSQVAIFNASRITYGNSWSAQKEPQQIAEDAGAVPIPFENVVAKEEGAGLDLSKLEVVDWAGPEKMIIPPLQNRWNSHFQVVERHFAGAALVKVEDEYFLFDADREELKWHGFNPFFTQLPEAAQTIQEAYDVLKPEEVHLAEGEGKKVVRQGEFFFVPVDEEEVKEHLNLLDDIDDFFYRQVRDRMREMGALVVNSYRAVDREEVANFIKKCRDNNDGRLDGGDVMAVVALKSLTDALSKQVGPEHAAVLTSNGGHLYGHSTIARDHVERELDLRLPTRADEGKTPDSGLRIFYEAVIGEEAEGWNRSQNNHQATGVIDLGNEHAYAIGAIIHRGREHRPVYLDGWHRVYANTATNNWTVSGDVD